MGATGDPQKVRFGCAQFWLASVLGMGYSVMFANKTKDLPVFGRCVREQKSQGWFWFVVGLIQKWAEEVPTTFPAMCRGPWKLRSDTRTSSKSESEPACRRRQRSSAGTTRPRTPRRSCASATRRGRRGPCSQRCSSPRSSRSSPSPRRGGPRRWRCTPTPRSKVRLTSITTSTRHRHQLYVPCKVKRPRRHTQLIITYFGTSSINVLVQPHLTPPSWAVAVPSSTQTNATCALEGHCPASSVSYPISRKYARSVLQCADVGPNRKLVWGSSVAGGCRCDARVLRDVVLVLVAEWRLLERHPNRLWTDARPAEAALWVARRGLSNICRIASENKPLRFVYKCCSHFWSI